MAASSNLIGGWEVEQEIGRGSFGRVYRAREVATGVTRALKVLEGAADPERLARFEREAQALARLRGKGVVAVHHLGVDRGRIFFVMDLAPAGSLRQRVLGGARPPWRESVAIVAKLARTLERCAALGLVHRDLKPENVLFDERGEPCIVDFGCVRDLDASRLTETGTSMGSPAYMAFEQLEGTPVGPPADVYALATILHELLAGTRPRTGDSLFDLLRQSRAAPPPIAPSLRVWPPELDALLARSLSANAEQRPTAAALAEGLEALASPDRRAKAAARPPARRGVAMGLLVLAGLASFAVTLTRSGEPPPPSPPEPGPVTSRVAFVPSSAGAVTVDDAALAQRIARSSVDACAGLDEAIGKARGRRLDLPRSTEALNALFAREAQRFSLGKPGTFSRFIDVAERARKLGVGVPDEQRGEVLAATVTADLVDPLPPEWMNLLVRIVEALGPVPEVIAQSTRRLEKGVEPAAALGYARRLAAVAPGSCRVQIALSEALDKVQHARPRSSDRIAERKAAAASLGASLASSELAHETVAFWARYWMARHLAALGEDDEAGRWLAVSLPQDTPSSVRAALLRAYLDASAKLDPLPPLLALERLLRTASAADARDETRLAPDLKRIEVRLDRWVNRREPDSFW